MELFDGPVFNFNGNGQMDGYEILIGTQMTASSREEAIRLTGDDSFYSGDDEED